MEDLLRLIFGLLLVFNGRRVVWLVAGAAGFLLGLLISASLLEQTDPLIVVGISLIIGLLAGGLAQALGQTAIALLGLIAGGVGAMYLMISLDWYDRSAWLAFGFGGLLGLILVTWLFDWAIILISTLIGAMLLTDAFDMGGQTAVLLFTALLIAGVAVQAHWMGRPEKK